MQQKIIRHIEISPQMNNQFNINGLSPISQNNNANSEESSLYFQTAPSVNNRNIFLSPPQQNDYSNMRSPQSVNINIQSLSWQKPAQCSSLQYLKKINERILDDYDDLYNERQDLQDDQNVFGLDQFNQMIYQNNETLNQNERFLQQNQQLEKYLLNKYSKETKKKNFIGTITFENEQQQNELSQYNMFNELQQNQQNQESYEFISERAMQVINSRKILLENITHEQSQVKQSLENKYNQDNLNCIKEENLENSEYLDEKRKKSMEILNDDKLKIEKSKSISPKKNSLIVNTQSDQNVMKEQIRDSKIQNLYKNTFQDYIEQVVMDDDKLILNIDRIHKQSFTIAKVVDQNIFNQLIDKQKIVEQEILNNKNSNKVSSQYNNNQNNVIQNNNIHDDKNSEFYSDKKLLNDFQKQQKKNSFIVQSLMDRNIIKDVTEQIKEDDNQIQEYNQNSIKNSNQMNYQKLMPNIDRSHKQTIDQVADQNSIHADKNKVIGQQIQNYKNINSERQIQSDLEAKSSQKSQDLNQLNQKKVQNLNCDDTAFQNYQKSRTLVESKKLSDMVEQKKSQDLNQLNQKKVKNLNYDDTAFQNYQKSSTLVEYKKLNDMVEQKKIVIQQILKYKSGETLNNDHLISQTQIKNQIDDDQQSDYDFLDADEIQRKLSILRTKCQIDQVQQQLSSIQSKKSNDCKNHNEQIEYKNNENFQITQDQPQIYNLFQNFVQEQNDQISQKIHLGQIKDYELVNTNSEKLLQQNMINELSDGLEISNQFQDVTNQNSKRSQFMKNNSQLKIQNNMKDLQIYGKERSESQDQIQKQLLSKSQMEQIINQDETPRKSLLQYFVNQQFQEISKQFQPQNSQLNQDIILNKSDQSLQIEQKQIEQISKEYNEVQTEFNNNITSDIEQISTHNKNNNDVIIEQEQKIDVSHKFQDVQNFDTKRSQSFKGYQNSQLKYAQRRFTDLQIHDYEISENSNQIQKQQESQRDKESKINLDEDKRKSLLQIYINQQFEHILQPINVSQNQDIMTSQQQLDQIQIPLQEQFQNIIQRSRSQNNFLKSQLQLLKRPSVFNYQNTPEQQQIDSKVSLQLESQKSIKNTKDIQIQDNSIEVKLQQCQIDVTQQQQNGRQNSQDQSRGQSLLQIFVKEQIDQITQQFQPKIQLKRQSTDEYKKNIQNKISDVIVNSDQNNKNKEQNELQQDYGSLSEYQNQTSPTNFRQEEYEDQSYQQFQNKTSQELFQKTEQQKFSQPTNQDQLDINNKKHEAIMNELKKNDQIQLNEKFKNKMQQDMVNVIQYDLKNQDIIGKSSSPRSSFNYKFEDDLIKVIHNLIDDKRQQTDNQSDFLNDINNLIEARRKVLDKVKTREGSPQVATQPRISLLDYHSFRSKSPPIFKINSIGSNQTSCKQHNHVNIEKLENNQRQKSNKESSNTQSENKLENLVSKKTDNMTQNDQFFSKDNLEHLVSEAIQDYQKMKQKQRSNSHSSSINLQHSYQDKIPLLYQKNWKSNSNLMDLQKNEESQSKEKLSKQKIKSLQTEVKKKPVWNQNNKIKKEQMKISNTHKFEINKIQNQSDGFDSKSKSHLQSNIQININNEKIQLAEKKLKIQEQISNLDKQIQNFASNQYEDTIVQKNTQLQDFSSRNRQWQLQKQENLKNLQIQYEYQKEIQSKINVQDHKKMKQSSSQSDLKTETLHKRNLSNKSRAISNDKQDSSDDPQDLIVLLQNLSSALKKNYLGIQNQNKQREIENTKKQDKNLDQLNKFSNNSIKDEQFIYHQSYRKILPNRLKTFKQQEQVKPSYTSIFNKAQKISKQFDTKHQQQ